MQFSVIPFLLAANLSVPPPRLKFRVSSKSAGVTRDSPLGTAILMDARRDEMICIPDSTSLRCYIRRESFFNHYPSCVYRGGPYVRTLCQYFPLRGFEFNNEPFRLEFNRTGVKLFSSSEMSEHKLRMLQQSIGDLFHVDSQLGGVRQGRKSTSTLHTIERPNGCPVTTRVKFQSSGKNSNQTGEFFKLTSHPDYSDEKFDEIFGNTTKWILDVTRTIDIKDCNSFHGYYFLGSQGENDSSHGIELITNITKRIYHMRITNEKFESTVHTRGTIVDPSMKFAVHEHVRVSIDLNDVIT